MKIKPGVKISGIKSQIIYAIFIADKIFSNYGLELTITSGIEAHTKGFHPVGLGVDFRIWKIPFSTLTEIIIALKAMLGKNYDVVLEKDHIHVEFDKRTKS